MGDDASAGLDDEGILLPALEDAPQTTFKEKIEQLKGQISGYRKLEGRNMLLTSSKVVAEALLGAVCTSPVSGDE